MLLSQSQRRALAQQLLDPAAHAHQPQVSCACASRATRMSFSAPCLPWLAEGHMTTAHLHPQADKLAAAPALPARRCVPTLI